MIAAPVGRNFSCCLNTICLQEVLGRRVKQSSVHENFVRSKFNSKANPDSGSSDDPVDGDIANGESRIGRED